MAENEEGTRRSRSKGSDEPDAQAVQATSDQYAGADPRKVASEEGTTARNPVEHDPDDLPPVPGAGQFMPPDQATEEVAPGPGDQSKG